MNCLSSRRRPQPKRMPYHYYKPRGPDECVTYLQNERGRLGSHHRFITEKQVFAHWAKQYNISYAHPTWWATCEKTIQHIQHGGFCNSVTFWSKMATILNTLPAQKHYPVWLLVSLWSGLETEPKWRPFRDPGTSQGWTIFVFLWKMNRLNFNCLEHDIYLLLP